MDTISCNSIQRDSIVITRRKWVKSGMKLTQVHLSERTINIIHNYCIVRHIRFNWDSPSRSIPKLSTPSEGRGSTISRTAVRSWLSGSKTLFIQIFFVLQFLSVELQENSVRHRLMRGINIELNVKQSHTLSGSSCPISSRWWNSALKVVHTHRKISLQSLSILLLVEEPAMWLQRFKPGLRIIYSHTPTFSPPSIRPEDSKKCCCSYKQLCHSTSKIISGTV